MAVAVIGDGGIDIELYGNDGPSLSVLAQTNSPSLALALSCWCVTREIDEIFVVGDDESGNDEGYRKDHKDVELELPLDDIESLQPAAKPVLPVERSKSELLKHLSWLIHRPEGLPKRHSIEPKHSPDALEIVDLGKGNVGSPGSLQQCPTWITKPKEVRGRG